MLLISSKHYCNENKTLIASHPTQDSRIMIELQHIAKSYPGGHEALLGINLQINQGELVFISGHSGAGKSTLLKLIALIERPTRGQILINGNPVSSLSPRAAPLFRRNLGIIFQDHKLLKDRSVFNNVALPLQITGMDPRTIARRTRAALDKVGLLEKEKLKPGALSTGQQQRVGIARAVVNRPGILLADEPTGNLDPALSAEIMQLFIDFNSIDVTVLLATHDQTLLQQFARRVVTLDHGKIVE